MYKIIYPKEAYITMRVHRFDKRRIDLLKKEDENPDDVISRLLNFYIRNRENKKCL
jgi:hypothetical protein